MGFVVETIDLKGIIVQLIYFDVLTNFELLFNRKLKRNGWFDEITIKHTAVSKHSNRCPLIWSYSSTTWYCSEHFVNTKSKRYFTKFNHYDGSMLFYGRRCIFASHLIDSMILTFSFEYSWYGKQRFNWGFTMWLWSQYTNTKLTTSRFIWASDQWNCIARK